MCNKIFTRGFEKSSKADLITKLQLKLNRQMKHHISVILPLQGQ